jgi:hypothetical protein
MSTGSGSRPCKTLTQSLPSHLGRSGRHGLKISKRMLRQISRFGLLFCFVGCSEPCNGVGTNCPIPTTDTLDFHVCDFIRCPLPSSTAGVLSCAEALYTPCSNTSDQQALVAYEACVQRAEGPPCESHGEGLAACGLNSGLTAGCSSAINDQIAIAASDAGF